MISSTWQKAVQFAAASVCTLLLAGCMHTTKTVFVHHYDLGAAVSASTPHGNPGHRHGEVLRVARIAVPEWLAGTGMHYRLDYRDDRQVAVYGHSDWAAPPATLLEPIIQNFLAADDGWRAVVGPDSPATADASLHIRLDDFSQVFSQPHDSAGVIDATATLIENHDDKVLTQRHFHVEVAAKTPDAQGGVAALAEASRQFIAHLQHWLQQGMPKHDPDPR